MIADTEKMQGYSLNSFNEQQRQQIIEVFLKVWSLGDGPTKVIVPAFNIDRYDLSEVTKQEMKKITEHGNIAFKSDLIAASMIEWLLIFLSDYKDVRIVFDNNDVDLYSPEFSDSNIISFCGPGGNYATKKLLENVLQIESPFVKEDDQNVLKWNGKICDPLLDENDEMLSDYGIIYKRRNPLTDKERYIYIFAGARAYATQGAAAALAIAGIIYEVFCLNETPTDEFTLPVMVSGDKPLNLLRDEILVSIIQPRTQLYKNHIDAVLSVSFLFSELWSRVISERQVDKAYNRHSYLVDKMFIEGLSVDERIEKEGLEELLDSYEAKFYEPIKQLLVDKLNELTEKKTSKGG